MCGRWRRAISGDGRFLSNGNRGSSTLSPVGERRLSFPLVVIGASPNSMEDVRAILSKVPADSPMAFAVIQHADRAPKDILTTLASKKTSRPVIEVSNGIAVRARHVYVVPPNKIASLDLGKFSLRPLAVQDRRPIDDFMKAVAAAVGDMGIGVVLAGAGPDGACGLSAIKTADGITFAQEPKTARSPVTPVAAIAAGSVDFVLSPGRIALELGRIAKRVYGARGRGETAKELNQILRILSASSPVPLSRYKHSTVARRVLRQMARQKISSLAQYAKFLRRDRSAAASLTDRILGPSTVFLGEPEDVQALRKYIRLRLRNENCAPVLCEFGSSACATGEEARTLSPCFWRRNWVPLQQAFFFGMQALRNGDVPRGRHSARACRYLSAKCDHLCEPSAAEAVLCQSSFQDSYRIVWEFAEIMCLRSRHDLTQDPAPSWTWT